MTAQQARVPRAGDPCPNGCTTHDRTGTGFTPERLAESEPGSGEIYCPACWANWNTLGGTR